MKKTSMINCDYMKNAHCFEEKDYKPLGSQLEKKLVILLLKLFFRNISFRATFGNSESIVIGKSEPQFSIAVPNLRSTLAICLFPSYMIAQQYCLGRWYCEGDLSEFLIYQISKSKNRSGLFRYSLIDKIIHIWKNYFSKNSSRDTRKHYDVDSSLYKCLLGDELVYSCAFFDDKHTDLDSAQRNKLATTFDRLSIDTSDEKLRILDIGCGWGQMVKFLAENSAASIDAITISREQCRYNTDHISDMYDNRAINFFESDIVDFSPEVHGEYDRIVSIAMLEHVGKNRFGEYFSCVKDLLSSGGIAVIHSIVKDGDGFNNAWIDKHIFPGGYIPKVEEIEDAISQSGLKLRKKHMHDGSNYKSTLQYWKNNLVENYDELYEIVKSNVSKEKNLNNKDIEYLTRCEIRKWYFYLSSVQSMFDEKAFGDNVCQFELEG